MMMDHFSEVSISAHSSHNFVKSDCALRLKFSDVNGLLKLQMKLFSSLQSKSGVELRICKFYRHQEAIFHGFFGVVGKRSTLLVWRQRQWLAINTKAL